MESEDLPIKYYLDEAKDTQHLTNEDEVHIPNDAELAAEFLHEAGLSNLTKIYQDGKEIFEHVVTDSVRQQNLTEKQAQTIRHRVQTLNKTLKSRQPRRKQRQDVRDVTWNFETSSTGTRSRSATPDSLDSVELTTNNTDNLEDEKQLSSLPSFPLLDQQQSSGGLKTKIKWTSSEPLPSKKFNKAEKCDIAHLGSENVILKGYQSLTENGTIPRRERSGSDPMAEIYLQPLKIRNNVEYSRPSPMDVDTQFTSVIVNKNCSKVYIHSNDENQEKTISFEGLVKQNENFQTNEKCDTIADSVNIDDLSDSEYQYLKRLLVVELFAIFDQYNISYIKRKISSKNKGGNVFGVNLSTLVMRDMQKPTNNTMVPEIFQSIVEQLNSRCVAEDGILRVTGQKQKLETLCSEIEANFFSNRKYVEDILNRAKAHELTGALKKLLRDLPEPLFTMELFDMFYKTSEITNIDDKIKALNLLVLMLPIEHRNTLRLLLRFFLNIISHEAQNRMNLHNVAMITAPSMFPPRLLLPKDYNKMLTKEPSKEELMKQINDAAVCCCTVEIILKTGEKLFTIPGYLANQAREAQKKAQIRKDLGKKEKLIGPTKIKLVRSSTQYEPGAMCSPRIKGDFV